MQKKLVMNMDRKYENVVFAILMAIVITIPMAFFMTLINIGFNNIFFQEFLKSLVIGIIVSAPIAFIVIPYVQELVKILID